MPKKKLVIFPFNGNGIEALDCINDDDFEFLGFVDDDPTKKTGKHKLFSRDILKGSDLFVLAVPGSPVSFRDRRPLIEGLEIEDSRFATIIHPSASIGKDVRFGYNCLVMAGAVVTSNAVIGNHVCILPNSVIHHDSVVDSFTLVGSNVVIAGGTHIGLNCYIGSGSNIINGIRVGDHSLIGLGSNIIQDVAPHSKMVGNPGVDISNRAS
jgi:sugar O-acyltransferase (sialic acid O-acetyltransferase NeuD family)